MPKDLTKRNDVKMPAKAGPAESQDRDEARAKALGMFRNRGQFWSLVHPHTRRVVSSRRTDLDAAIETLSRDLSIEMQLRKLACIAQQAATPRSVRSSTV